MEPSLNHLSHEIIAAAIEVHHVLGAGMLESAYDACLCHELLDRGLGIERQKAIPLVYKDKRLDCGYRLDIVVNEAIVVEVKAVEKILPVHCAQVLSYLRLSHLTLGLLLNFNVKWFTDGGIRRIVNGFAR